MKIKKKEIGQFIIDDVNVADSFLDYNKRNQEDEIAFSKYCNNPTLVNSLKYLYYSFSITLNYIQYYRKLLYARFKSRKNIISLNIFYVLMIILSFINLFIGISIHIFTQLFRIVIFPLEFICMPIVYLILISTNNNYGNLKDCYKYITNRFIGREEINNNTNIIRLIVSGIYGIKIIDWFKNIVVKINSKHQLKIAEKTVRKYNKNNAKSGNMTKLKRRQNRKIKNKEMKLKKTKEERIKINKLTNEKRKLKSEYYNIYFKKIEKDMTKISANIVNSVVKKCDIRTNNN